MNELIKEFQHDTGWDIQKNPDDDGMYCWKDFGNFDTTFYVQEYKHSVDENAPMLSLSISTDEIEYQLSLAGMYEDVKEAALALNKLHRIKPIF